MAGGRTRRARVLIALSLTAYPMSDVVLSAPSAAAVASAAAIEPTQFFPRTIDATTIELAWKYGRPPVSSGPGGTVRWDIRVAAGTASAAGIAGARRFTVQVRGARDYGDEWEYEFRLRVASLVPHAPYSFAIRAVDASGGTTAWRETMTATRPGPGSYLATAEPGKAARLSRLPGASPGSVEQYLAVEPDGTAHVSLDDGEAGSDARTSYGAAPRRSAWRAAPLPADVALVRSHAVRVGTSQTRSGFVAVSDGSFVYVRTPGRSWSEIGYLSDSPGDGPYITFTEDSVQGLHLDRSNKVHVLWRTNPVEGRPTLRYGTNASGRWKTQDVSKVTSQAVALFAYDAAADRLALVVGDYSATNFTRYQLRVTAKSSTAATFERFATTYDGPRSRALIPTGLAAWGRRITVAAQRVNLETKGIWGTPVIVSGTSPASVGGMVSVPGVPKQTRVLLAATSTGRVVLGIDTWEFGPRQGLWTMTRTYRGGTATWSRATRHTPSAYDRLDSVGVDSAGGTYLLFARL